MRRAALLALCLPWNGLGALVAGIALLCRWEVSCGWDVTYVSVPEGSWVSRHWPYSTTLGHVVVMHPASTLATYDHEGEHVRQFEGWCCTAWIAYGIACLSPYYAIAVAPWLAYAGASVAAWLRSEHWYRANTYERGARGAACQAVE